MKCEDSQQWTWPQGSFPPLHTDEPLHCCHPFPGLRARVRMGTSREGGSQSPSFGVLDWWTLRPAHPTCPRRPFTTLHHVAICLWDNPSSARKPGPLKPQRQLGARRKIILEKQGLWLLHCFPDCRCSQHWALPPPPPHIVRDNPPPKSTLHLQRNQSLFRKQTPTRSPKENNQTEKPQTLLAFSH